MIIKPASGELLILGSIVVIRFPQEAAASIGHGSHLYGLSQAIFVLATGALAVLKRADLT